MKWMFFSVWLLIGSLNYLRTDVYPEWKVRNSGIDAEGVITEVYVIESERGDVEGARLTIEFIDNNGNTQRFVGVQDDYSRFNDTPGSKVAIRYLPNNPQQAMTVAQTKAPPSGSLALGIVFLALSIGLGIYGFKNRD